MTGRTLSCLLSALLVLPALLHAQRNRAPGDPVSERARLTGTPVHNILVQPSHTIPGPPGLRSLAQHAGTIFSGTVTSVVPVAPTSPGEIPAVAITFHVEQAIRGAVPGQPLTIREWRGLWDAAPRYRAGQRMLLFLFPRSRLGLTSTVAGSLGRFRLDASGRVLLNPQQAAAFASEPKLKAATRIPFPEFARAVRHSLGEDLP